MRITDHEFADSVLDREQLYQRELRRPPRESYIDPIGTGRWATDYYTLRLSGLGHEAAKREIRRRIRDIEQIPDPEEPERPTRSARGGRVRLERRSFVDDLGPYVGCEYTDMSALRIFEHDRDRHDANCREMVARGATTRRILGMVGWPGRVIDPRRPDIGDLTRSCIEVGYAHGVRTRLTLFADCNVLSMRMDERRTHTRRIIAALKGIEHMIEAVEISNEPGYAQYNGPWTVRELLELAHLVKRELGVLVGCGAPWGGRDSATAWTEPMYEALMDGVDLAFPHFDRDVGKHDGYERPIRQPWDAFILGFPFVNGEPIGPGSSVVSETNAGRLRAAATFTWLARGAGYCYHTHAGIGIDTDDPIWHAPGADVVFDGARVLAPDSVQFDAHNWHWSSNPWETVDGCLSDKPRHERGSVRTISGVNGGRVQTQVLRVTAGVTLRARAAMQVDIWYGGDEGPYQKVAESRHVAPGGTIELGSCVDTLLVGRFV